MPPTPELARRFELRDERFEHAGHSWSLCMPRAADELIDEEEFERDERLPYWADLWPAGRALAQNLIDQPPGALLALELGCGIALPSLALLALGEKVVASDYYPDALEFARANALRNGLGELATELIDWREPNGDLARFDLIIGADLTYEARNVALLTELLPRLLTPHGRIRLADPGRAPHGVLLARLRELGFLERVLEKVRIPAPVAPSFATTDRRPQVEVTIRELWAG